MRAARLALAAVLIGLPAAAPEPKSGAGIEIAYLNRTWDELSGDFEAVQEGPLSVRLRSPDGRVTVHRNRLLLTPGAGADPDAVMEAELEGAGDLHADVDGALLATTLEDRVLAPRQTVRVRGRARIESDATGYDLYLVEGPPSAPVRIQSRLAGEVVELCRGMALFGGASCDRLQSALSVVNVPLGGRERALRLPRERLAPAERAYLDRFAVERVVAR